MMLTSPFYYLKTKPLLFEKKGFIALSILTLILLSCSYSPRIILFNNSQMAVTVKIDSKIYQINHSAPKEFELPGSNIIVIESENKTLKYKIPTIPIEYMPRVSGNREILFQLEPGFLIFVLKPTAQLPKLDFAIQPKGFPLSPEKELKMLKGG